MEKRKFLTERFRKLCYCSDVAGSNHWPERTDEIPIRSKQLSMHVWVFLHQVTNVSYSITALIVAMLNCRESFIAGERHLLGSNYTRVAIDGKT